MKNTIQRALNGLGDSIEEEVKHLTRFKDAFKVIVYIRRNTSDTGGDIADV